MQNALPHFVPTDILITDSIEFPPISARNH